MRDGLIDRLEVVFRSYAGVTLTRDWLAAYVWREVVPDDSRAIDVAVSDVRKRLGSGEEIEGVPGVGYRLIVPQSAARGGSDGAGIATAKG